MSVKKILMLVGDYVEDYEVMVPFQALQMVGHVVYAVCPGKKAGDTVRTAIHDFDGAQTYSEKLGHAFTLNADFESVCAEEYDALILPGGRAPEYLRLDDKVITIIRSFHEARKPIASICHGAQLLTAAGVLQDYRLNGYPAVAPEIRSAGAEYVELPWEEALVDRHFVSAPAWTAHPKWLSAFLVLLGTRIEP